MILARVSTESGKAEHFGEWFAKDHSPAVRKIAGVLSARYYQCSGSDFTGLVMYHLKDIKNAEDDIFKGALGAPFSGPGEKPLWLAARPYSVWKAK